MALPVQTAKQFIDDAYSLISANSPTVPLHGSDFSRGLRYMNSLLKFYSASGLLITVAKTVQFTVAIGQSEITFGDALYTPTPDVPLGRLANLQNAWLTLQGVTYPLVDESRNVFYGSYKYDPQMGLPRFCIITNETNLTRMRIYPGPSQVYTLNVYGKFQLSEIGPNDDMSSLPDYFYRFFSFAVAKDLSFYKGRSAAWDEKLEGALDSAKKDMESVSSVNLTIDSSSESYLNGAWRVKAGI